jgi:hypothetical protein
MPIKNARFQAAVVNVMPAGVAGEVFTFEQIPYQLLK